MAVNYQRRSKKFEQTRVKLTPPVGKVQQILNAMTVSLLIVPVYNRRIRQLPANADSKFALVDRQLAYPAEHCVLDKIIHVSCVTMLHAQFSQELSKREPRSFVWNFENVAMISCQVTR